MKNGDLVIGMDYGTDSVRTVIIDSGTGEEVSHAVCHYPRWGEGLYCDPQENRFRQHPRDYITGLEESVSAALDRAPQGTADQISAITIDTTGSTPAPVDSQGIPLAMHEEFQENPHAMFILWKDHTAIREAEQITQMARNWGGEDFTRYEGGIYSSEWFWAKMLYTLRHSQQVRDKAYSWVEHCDWMPALLTGNSDPHTMKRSRCAAGHKAMWHASWDGLPPEEYLKAVDPLLEGVRDRLYGMETCTCDESAGTLSPEWAERLGLPGDVVVGVGAFDAHLGAVGAEIKPRILSKVMGTSTCDMMVVPPEELEGRTVRGIAGQVDGSVIPGYIGLEAGQSAFGDIYAWFESVLSWPLQNLVANDQIASDSRDGVEQMAETLLPALNAAAAEEEIDPAGIVALDWMNGRRTPDANQRLKGVISRLNLGSTAPKIFRALVESTAFGAKRIVDRFESEGVGIDSVIALGGVPKRSSFVMQVVADVLNRSISVARSEQASALGSAMAAATVAGIHPTIREAQNAMGQGFEQRYDPIPGNAEKYQQLYQKYCRLGDLVENHFTGSE